ncbi:pupal cuticle protein 20-like [Anticarsia gemmatalis]|uniref:pupal cuticle protein 20-like n=1 Tax=Anticarsia gemmatalis TaxID=129554 RepID=UPI003F763B86
MAGLKLISVLALMSAVSAGHLGHFQPSTGYSSFGANAYSAASAYSGSYNGGAHIPILRYENVNNGDGTYRYNYETGNGISAHESGAPRAPGPEGPAVTAEGGFSYTAPNGQQVSLSYTADEHGFHPVGSHIPTPPPIPEAILRSIEYNRQHPSSGDGAYNGGRYHHGYNY